MIYKQTNKWPIYISSSGQISIDSAVYDEMCRTVLRDPRDMEAVMDGLAEKIFMTSYTTSSGNFTQPMFGPEGILCAMCLLNAGIPTIPAFGEGSYVVRMLAHLSRYDLLEKYVDYNFVYEHVNPSILLGLLQCSDVPHVAPFLKKITGCQVKLRGTVGSDMDKWRVVRGFIPQWRRSHFDTRLEKMEKMAERGRTQDVVDSPDFSDKTAFMFMCRDPYKRMKFFRKEWRFNLYTIDKIRRKWPFALPDDMDLDLRDRDALINGIETLQSRMKGTAMDRHAVTAMLKAYRKLTSEYAVSPSENRKAINFQMISYCLYSDDPVSIVDTALDRMAPSVDGVQLIYIPGGVKGDAMRRALLKIVLSKRFSNINVRPLPTYEL